MPRAVLARVSATMCRCDMHSQSPTVNDGGSGGTLASDGDGWEQAEPASHRKSKKSARKGEWRRGYKSLTPSVMVDTSDPAVIKKYLEAVHYNTMTIIMTLIMTLSSL